MADQRILATENMIGANHPTLSDTLNRHGLIAHENDGTHKFILDTTQSTSATTGAIITAGGVGVAKDVHIAGQLHSTATTQSTSGTTGAIITDGGIGAAKDIFTAGKVSAPTLESTIAIGTAPLTVTSTTKVTNLNADLLDGYNTATTRTASAIPVLDASAQILVNGVSFPATQAASADANTLDDYEEGTWTPVLYGSSTAGTYTYSVQSGVYTKIGRMVHITGRITVTGVSGSPSGNWRVSGLPFNPAVSTPLVIGDGVNFPLAGTGYYLYGLVNSAGYIEFLQNNSTVNGGNHNTAPVSVGAISNTAISFSASYSV